MSFMRSSFRASILLFGGIAAASSAQEFRPLDLPAGFRERSVSHDDPRLPKDKVSETSNNATRDLTAESYYNRPGAKWGEYLQDWYACDEMTRGSRVPGGRFAYVHSPSMISPRDKGVGATIGGAVGTVDRGEAQRMANRDTCLRVRGWRKVIPDETEAARIKKLTGYDADDWWEEAVGLAEPLGRIETRAATSLPDDPSINPDATPAGSPQVWVGKGANPRQPVTVGGGEGALVLAFRRPDTGSSGQRASIVLRRYDATQRELLEMLPASADTERNFAVVEAQDRKASYEVQVTSLPAGLYVIDGTSVDGQAPAETNCFGAPVIEVPAGGVVYAGDWVPYRKVKLASGKTLPDALVMVPHFDQAKAALATAQPALAEKMQPMAVANGATYSCTNPNVVMGRFSLAGLPEPEGDGG